MSEVNTANEKPVALVRQTTTVSIAFVEKPTEERRRQLREAGYRYENGTWFKPDPRSAMVSEEQVAQILAA